MIKQHAVELLRAGLNNPQAQFKEDQWECIEAILNSRRLLVVEKTGWGKSMVYFLATRLLREQGKGPTLLISPLLSLMRNQLEAANRIGINAATINSSNTDDWDGIAQDLQDNKIDLLLVSPERLANDKFRKNILAPMAAKIGLFAVDEAHCISDWGHDFRPDYRRIIRVIQLIPGNIPILATTATANDRVVNDIIHQLGNDVFSIRGNLVRESLKLQNIAMPDPAARMAWLAEIIPTLPGSGIVYTLTQRDAEIVSNWLNYNGIVSQPYHSDIANDEDGNSIKEEREQQLLNNEIKVLAATVALGMGFDKPDLGFVIHFQRPSSVVHYYQQVGRAGRAVESAYGILLCGEEDDRIAEYFINNAFPPQHHVTDILAALQDSNGMSVRDLQNKLNLKYGQIEKALKFLTIESPAPITKLGTKYHVTPASATYRIDEDYVNKILALRRSEQEQMQAYMKHGGCLMQFLAEALNDDAPGKCGKCANCVGQLLPTGYSSALVNKAAVFLRRSHQTLKPRKQWPHGKPLPQYGFSGKIALNRQVAEGRALCLWRDAGWGTLVADGKTKTAHFDDSLVDACVELLAEWAPSPAPGWVTCVPSLTFPDLVPDFAARLAKALNLPFVAAIRKIHPNESQKFMANSFQQAYNLDGAFEVDLPKQYDTPCLLVDDMVDSQWTFTVLGALLRKAGCPAVYPLALALNSPRMD